MIHPTYLSLSFPSSIKFVRRGSYILCRLIMKIQPSVASSVGLNPKSRRVY